MLLLLGIAICDGSVPPPGPPSPKASAGIMQIAPSVSSAACVVATNMSSTEWRDVGATTHRPTTNATTITMRRRTSGLRCSRALLAGRVREKVRVIAGEHLIDYRLDRAPRVGRVVGHVIARRVDAGDLRPPVLGQQLIGVAVARREGAHLRVVEALEPPRLDQGHPPIGASEVHLVIREVRVRMEPD